MIEENLPALKKDMSLHAESPSESQTEDRNES